jgi:hypothetical protein
MPFAPTKHYIWKLCVSPDQVGIKVERLKIEVEPTGLRASNSTLRKTRLTSKTMQIKVKPWLAMRLFV